MKNPAWQEAEETRLAAEKDYANFMKNPENLVMREDEPEKFVKQVNALNAAITAANREVRITPQNLASEDE